MLRGAAVAAAVLALSGPRVGVAAGPAAAPGLDDFFSGISLEGAALSPDGRYAALLVRQDGKRIVAVRDRRGSGPARPVLESRAGDALVPRWCHWANDTRVVCGYRGLDSERGHSFPVTRLVAINADGSDLRVLGNRRAMTTSDVEDQVLDWTPANPRSILVELDEGEAATVIGSAAASVIGGGSDGYPGVYELDVYTGARRVVLRERAPISHFYTDGQGQVRLGVAFVGDEIAQFAKPADGGEWRELSREKAFVVRHGYDPALVVPGTDFAWAYSMKDGRNALWKVDLANSTAPELVFAHPTADVDGLVVAPADGRVIGVRYNAERPEIHYLDPAAARAADALAKALPGYVIEVQDLAAGGKAILARVSSDVAPPMYLVMDEGPGGATIDVLGKVAPGLSGKVLSRMQPVRFPARDGTPVPAYLTLPEQTSGQPPPLVVLPHGGPLARDTWGFDVWVQFLAARGYAVLQPQYRGSTGYGDEWMRAGFRDWSGLPYQDVVDGARWVLAGKQADASRVCIVGASYGGYLAELAATRNADGLFRCAVAIAGVSDLVQLRTDVRRFRQWRIATGTFPDDPAVLREASPRQHVADVNVPMLLVHGERDYTVEVEHTRAMDAALTRAGKVHETLLIPGADHYFLEAADERVLLQAVGRFLDRELAPRR